MKTVTYTKAEILERNYSAHRPIVDERDVTYAIHQMRTFEGNVELDAEVGFCATEEEAEAIMERFNRSAARDNGVLATKAFYYIVERHLYMEEVTNEELDRLLDPIDEALNN